VLPQFQSFPAMKLYNPMLVDRVDLCPIIRKESGERPPHNFRSINDCDCLSMESVSLWKDSVVHGNVFEKLFFANMSNSIGYSIQLNEWNH
jgi:hypothetical protein